MVKFFSKNFIEKNDKHLYLSVKQTNHLPSLAPKDTYVFITNIEKKKSALCNKNIQPKQINILDK